VESTRSTRSFIESSLTLLAPRGLIAKGGLLAGRSDRHRINPSNDHSFIEKDRNIERYR
jgi:hypothetical protein